MKRILALLLIMITLTGMPGCAPSQEDACMRFLTCMQSGQYREAYAMLSASSRNDTGEAPSSRITEKEFVDRHTAIFEALGITSIAYSDVKITKGEILTTVSYTATYHSETIGDMTNQFKLTAVREGGEWYIEWSPALIFPAMQWGDTVRVARIPAKRGEILADGEVLAATVGTISVYASPSKIEDEDLFLSQISPLLNMTQEAVKKKLDAAYNDIAVLKQFYSDELQGSLHDQLLQINGIGIDNGNYGTHREYPLKSALAHIIGYVGYITGETKEELQEKLDAMNEGRNPEDGLYTSDSPVGKLGLEQQYEETLRGKDGKLIYICTSEGINRQTLYSKPVQNGYDLELTIDIELQERLQEVMDLVLFGETTAGAVVVMNPLTGEIQATCSYPSYDLNLFARGMTDAEYAALTQNPAKPLFNRLTQGRYPPGSVLKAFTAAALLDTSTLAPSYEFRGKIEDDYWTPTEFGPWIWPPIKRSEMKNRTAPLNMHNAIITSDNIYFANAALLLGEQGLFGYLKYLGFDESLPFDISIAKPQLINEGTELTLKMLADSGYGQGEILLTPLQLASAFSAFANGGDILVPRIIKGIYESNGILSQSVQMHEKRVWRSNVISKSTISTLTPILEHVVSRDYNGTGHSLRVTGCTVAAKTGTAEVGDDKSREISWFVGYRTGVSEKDGRLVLVMLEIPSEDQYSQLKFDIARELLKLETQEDDTE